MASSDVESSSLQGFTFHRVTARQIAWAGALAGLWLILFILFIPSEPFFPPSEPDASWMMTLHWAHLNGIDFGHQLIFTYGPWGFICHGYHPRTYGLTFGGWVLFSSAFFAGIVRLSHEISGRWWIRLAWLAAVIGLAGLQLPLAPDFRLYSLCWLFLILHFHIDVRAISAQKVLLAIAMALASLCKSSFAVAAAGAVVTVSFDEVIRRRIPWAMLVFLAGVITFWICAGQQLSSLLPFVQHSVQIVAAYSQAQAMEARSEWLDVLAFLLTAAFLLVICLVQLLLESRGVGNSRKSRLTLFSSVPGVAAIAFALFMTFKAGYVRHDESHAPVGAITLAILSILFAGAIWRKLVGRVFAKALVVISACASIALVALSLSIWTESGLPRHLLDSLEVIPSHAEFALKSSGVLGDNILARHYAEYLEDWRARRPLPEIPQGTSVDVYPFGQAEVLAHGLRFQPRPVFQSYVVSTARLAELNADFLRKPDAPKSILLDVASVDQHYPSLDDAASWPLLLTRYDLKDASHLLLLLEQAGRPREYSLIHIQQTRATMNTWVAIPESTEPIWAAIDVEATAAGSILKALYKPPALYLDVRTHNGSENRYRLVPDIARGGFLLSPAVDDAASFAFLFSSRWREYLDDWVVTAIRISTDSASGMSPAYEASFGLKLEALRYPTRDISAIPGITDQLVFRRFLKEMHVVRADRAFLLGLESGRPLLVTPGGSQISLRVPAGAKSLHVGFGLGRQSSSYGRAQFRIYTTDIQSERRGEILWSDQIAPGLGPPAGRSTDIRLPASAPAAVILEIIPAQDTFDPYWTDVRFE